MKFVWLTDNYRVNIESIFSLQRNISYANPEYIKWEAEYNEIYEEIFSRRDDIVTIDDKEYSYDEVCDNEELYDKYCKYISDEVTARIGYPECEKYIYTYTIITHTGIKIDISKDKYDLINEYIDKI